MSTVKTNNVQVGLSLTSTNNFTWYQPAVVDGTVRLGNGNAGSVTDVLTATSAGNVGIGTSSPASPLHIATASAELVRLQGTASAGFIRFANESNTSIAYVGRQNTNDLYLWNSTANSIRLGTNNVMAALIDASGNLGLGVAPSAWESGTYKGLQVGPYTAVSDGYGYSGVANNSFYGTGGWKYTNTGASSLYAQYSGSHLWLTATSGTAGNAISFTQAMTLDASGRLGVGTTGPAEKLQVAGNIAIDTTEFNTPKYIKFNANSDGAGGVGYGGITWYNYQWSVDKRAEITSGPSSGGLNSGYLAFSTGTGGISERMRIDSSGEVYIAGTTDRGAYNLQCNGTGVWGAGAYVNGSDIALKENVQDLPSSLDVVNAIRPVKFTYKEEYSKDRSVQTGFIAQELQQALAGQDYLDGIVQAGPEHLNVAYQSLIPLLVKSIQEQQEQINQLKAEVAALKGN